jgi:hypothetical protein
MTLHEAYKKVLRSHGNDINKTMKWFSTALFEFKHKSPNEMIKAKKQKMVIDYINKHFIY